MAMMRAGALAPVSSNVKCHASYVIFFLFHQNMMFLRLTPIAIAILMTSRIAGQSLHRYVC